MGTTRQIPDRNRLTWVFVTASPYRDHLTSKEMDAMARLWHNHGMTRIRVSTTVDGALLEQARDLSNGGTDSSLLDAALSAFVAANRRAEIDEAYVAYETQPLDGTDEWGDLASFHDAASKT